jgi:hypothetical protein
MLSEIGQGINLLGVLGGIGSSAFLICDRFLRGRPLAFLVPEGYLACLCLRNLSNETLIVDEITVSPPILSPSNASDLQSAQRDKGDSWYPKDGQPKTVFIILKPGDTRTFALKRSAEFEESDVGRKLGIRCRWRDTRVSLPVHRYVRVNTNVGDVRNLREASLANKA